MVRLVTGVCDNEQYSDNYYNMLNIHMLNAQ